MHDRLNFLDNNMDPIISNIDCLSESFWSNIAEQYLLNQYKEIRGYPSLQVRQHYILDLFDQNNGKILDVGCGPGELMIELMRRGCDVCGVDIAPEMLRVAERNIRDQVPSGSFELRQANIEELPFDDCSFDAVIASGVIEYLWTDHRAIKEMHRVLKIDGTLLVTARNRYCLPRILDPLLDFMKSASRKVESSKLLDAVLPSSSRNSFTPYRKHSPSKLDRHVAECGFRKEAHRYFHFYPFFIPMDKVFPEAFVKMGLRMERILNRSGGCLASGYILKARKIA